MCSFFIAVVACGGSGDPSPGGSGDPPTNGTGPSSSVPLSIVTELSETSFQIRETEKLEFRFKLSGPPGPDGVDISIRQQSGDATIDIAPDLIHFTASDWNEFQSVELTATEDAVVKNREAVLLFEGPDVLAIERTVREIDAQNGLETTLSVLRVTEGGRAAVGVRPRSAPQGNLIVTASLSSASPDVSIDGATTLTFTPANWQQYQRIAVRVASDPDRCVDTAILELFADDKSYASVEVVENDRQAGARTAGEFTLCGTIRAPDFTAVDSDINDNRVTSKSNNSIALAQRVSNPVMLGGYVNTPGGGPQGRSQEPGDVSDFFAVHMTAGQQVTLHTANDFTSEEKADVELHLLDTTGVTLDSVIGRADVKSLLVARDGDYVVEVSVCQATACLPGGTNYVLSIGQPSVSALTAASSALRLSDEFVTGDVIVKWKATNARALVATAAAPPSNITAVAGDASRQMLYQVDTSLHAASSRALTNIAPARQFASKELAAKFETLTTVRDLQYRSDVEYAQPNFISKSFAVPNDPLYVLQWHYPIINLPAAWDMTTGSSDVIVGVIDTGVLLAHPDLAGQTVAGYDFIRSPANAGDGDSIDANPNDPGDDRVNGSSFHGSHVAGTIAAATNNGQGSAGIAWGAKIMPLRALGQLGGTDYDVGQALLYAAGLANDSKTVPARRADIVNLSFGGPTFSQAALDIVTRVRAAGVIVIAAAGNESTSALSYPAAFDGVVAVSAVDYNKQFAPYSNFGSYVDVAAPGGDLSKDANADGTGDGVLSTGASDRTGSIVFRYPIFQGTSMASPHVAGVAALMKSVLPGLTPQLFDDLLRSGKLTEDVGAPGRDDRYGYGVIDAFKAVNEARILAQNGNIPPPLPPQAGVQPSTLNFGVTATSLTFTVSNVGGDGLQVISTATNQPWLRVNPLQVDSNGVGTYRVSVSRLGLVDQNYDGQIRVVTSAGERLVNVVMEVSRVPVAASVGYQYVILVDSVNHKKVAAIDEVAVVNGMYQFSLEGALPGTYHLYAGSDMDQDGRLCDPGEACGAFRTLEQPQLIEVISADVNGLDFTTSYPVNFSTVSNAGGTQPALPIIEPIQMPLR